MNSNLAKTIKKEIITFLESKDALDLLPEIVQLLSDEASSYSKALVYSASSLSANETNELEKAIRSKYGNKEFTYIVDPSILSGLRIEVGKTVIDTTGKRSLEQLKENIKEKAHA